MTKRACPPLEAFEDLLDLPPEDARRRHLEECPRCKARMTAFRAFLDVEPVPQGARIGDARPALRAAIEAETKRRLHGAHRPGRPGFWEWFARPAWKAALGVAIVLIAVFLGGRGLLDQGEVRAPVLRDGNVATQIAAPSVSRLDDGVLRLRWAPMDQAESYQVLLYGADLQELRAIEGGNETESTLAPSQLQGIAGQAPAVFVRIAALRQRDRIALSAPAVIPPR